MISPAPDLPPLVSRQGVFRQILILLGEDLYKRGAIDIRETFIDGSFSPAKKRGHFVGPTKRGKGTKIMAIGDASGLPIAIDIQSASPHEVKLVERTSESRFVSKPTERMIGDKAYDSDSLDNRLRELYGTELIAPHKVNRKKSKTQDGRVLRRYTRRWKIERFVFLAS